DPGERAVADVARRRLRGEPEPPRRGPRVLAPRREGQPQPPRLLRYEGHVTIRLASAPAVVHVAYGEDPPRFARDLGGSVPEGRRVGTPGGGEQGGRATRDQAGLRRALQGCEHRVHASMVRHPVALALSSGLTCRLAQAYEDWQRFGRRTHENRLPLAAPHARCVDPRDRFL